MAEPLTALGNALLCIRLSGNDREQSTGAIFSSPVSFKCICPSLGELFLAMEGEA